MFLFRHTVWVMLSPLLLYGVNGQDWYLREDVPQAKLPAAPGINDSEGRLQTPPPTHERPKDVQSGEDKSDLNADLDRDKAERTTVPESEVIAAMKVEVGTYSPFDDEFKYVNNQYMNNYSRPITHGNDRCVNDFLRCLVEMPIPIPVCAYHDYVNRNGGVYLFRSTCEFYFEECRRGYRKFKVIGVGYCFTGDGYYKFAVYPLRRLLDSKIMQRIRSPFKYFTDNKL